MDATVSAANKDKKTSSCFVVSFINIMFGCGKNGRELRHEQKKEKRGKTRD